MPLITRETAANRVKGDWGLGTGKEEAGEEDNYAQSPITNTQSPLMRIAVLSSVFKT